MYPELAAERHVLALRFEGGNTTPGASSEWSNRDGYGARVTIELDGQRLEREHRCGEGLAAQNSATMLVGIGAHENARVTVHWPSGREQTIESVAAGALATFHEDAAGWPNEGVELASYTEDAAALDASARPAGESWKVLFEEAPGTSPASRLRVYTTMATWCASCKRELPRVRHLRESFSPEDVAFFGVPIDDDDDPAKLASYRAEWEPGYELLAELPREDAGRVASIVRRVLQTDGLPCTIVTDDAGTILHVQMGAPTVSELRRLLATAG